MGKFKSRELTLFENACAKGNLAQVKEIIEKDREFNRINVNDGFRLACSNDQLEVVRYLCNSNDTKYKLDIHSDSDAGLFGACYHGFVSVARYLLTSPELKEYADVNARSGNCFVYACENGHLNVVKLLLSNEIKKPIDLHVQNDNAFIGAVTHKHLDIIQFLIFDCNIEKTKDIMDFLNKRPQEEVERMFKIREFNEKLQKDIKTDDIRAKRLKV